MEIEVLIVIYIGFEFFEVDFVDEDDVVVEDEDEDEDEDGDGESSDSEEEVGIDFELVCEKFNELCGKF